MKMMTTTAAKAHSPLIGEGATGQEDRAIRAALEQTEKVDRLIYIRTHYLAPTSDWWRPRSR